MAAARGQNTFTIMLLSSYILRRPQNFAKSPPYFCLHVDTDASKVQISQNFVAFSEYMKITNVKKKDWKNIESDKRSKSFCENIFLYKSVDKP